jgi:four helix bundle protein
MKQRKDGEASLDRKFSETMKLINVYLNHFPKHERYALCNRIRNTAYDIYDLITEGQKRYYKKTTLSSLDIAHEKLRMQIYLAYELGYFKFKDGRTSEKSPEQLEEHRFVTLSALVDELGKMIGAWIAKVKQNGNW